MTDIFSDLDRVILRSLQTTADATTYYTPVNGSRRKLDDVIFRSPGAPVEGTDLVFEGVGPQFSVHVEDCQDLAQGDLFERDGVKYIVKTVDRDEGYMLIARCRLY